VDLRKFVLPSHCLDLIVETELDLGDHSERIRVKRDLALCELLNRNIGILCGWSNFENKSCVFLPTHFDLLIVIAQVCSWLEFNLTLGVIPNVYVASSCSLNFFKF
jgi:hypothetical protein